MDPHHPHHPQETTRNSSSGPALFRLREDTPGTPAATVPVDFEGSPLQLPAQATVAAALLVAGIGSFRSTTVSGTARGPYCMMGVCFDCLLEIDGVPNRQSCLVPVRVDMRIRRQQGARALADGGGAESAEAGP